MRVPIMVLAGSLLAIPSATAQTRGELLYATHCIACHTTEKHWRDKRSAGSWPALTVQVRRWQDAAALAWSDSDVLAVSRYLNDAYYRFEVTAGAANSAAGRGFEPARQNALVIERPAMP